MEEENKLCCNCKYMTKAYNEEPCKSCHHRSNWENKAVKFRTGDLVVLKDDHDETKRIYIYLRNKWVVYVPSFVVVRSICNFCFSDYIDKLIGNSNVSCSWVDDIEYASPEVITEHDRKAMLRYWSPKSLNDWLSEILEEEPKKIDETFTLPKRTTTDPQTVYKFKNGSELKVLTTPNMIKNVIFRDPATIIFWEDGTKTVVKTQDGEKYDKEKGFAMAVCKKVFGNERDYYHVFKRWMRKGKEVK